jgi:photosystem II stability/assembly factor-like uncharacterized protein
MKHFKLILLFSFLFSIYLHSQNFSWQWQNSQPYGFSLQHSLILDNGTILLFGEKSTILKSTDNGVTWERSVPDSLGGMRTIYSASFINNNTGYFCGAGGMIAKTTDGGANWTFLTSGVTTNLLEISFYDDSYGFAGGSSAVLLKTTDGGQNWIQYPTSTTSGEIYRITFAPGTNGTTVYLGSGVTTIGRVSKTTDSGNNWSAVASYPATSVVRGIKFVDANTGYLANGTFQIYKTTDGGQTMTMVHNPGTGVFYDLRISSNGNVYAAGSRGEVYKSADQGATWTQHNSLLDVTVNTIAVKENLLMAAASGGIFSKSSDAGVSWTLLSKTATLDELRDIMFVSDQVGFAVGGSTTAGVILKTTDGGSNWNKLLFTPDYRVRSQYWFNESAGFVGKRGPDGIYKTTDGGLTFETINTGLGTSTQAWNVIAFANADTGYIAGENGNYCRTTDGGLTWTVLPNNLHHGSSIIYDISVIDAKTIVSMGASGKIFKSTDAGQTFTDISGLGTTSAMYAVDFYDANLGFLVGSSGRIYKTTNGGLNWSYTTPVGTTTLMNVKMVSPDIVWVIGYTGTVTFTTDGGLNWTVSESFPVRGLTRNMFGISSHGAHLWIAGATGTIIKGYSDPVPVEMISFSASSDKDGILLSWQTATETNNRGFEVEQFVNGSWENIGFVNGNGTTTELSSYSFRINTNVTGVYSFRLKQIDYDGTYAYTNVIEVNTSTPASYSLMQNYPNPFNPSTAITFDIPSKEHVTLKIYDVLGNLIKEVIDGEKEAGRHTIYFNASNVSSGVYFYELKAGNYSATRKMLLMK